MNTDEFIEYYEDEIDVKIELVVRQVQDLKTFLCLEDIKKNIKKGKLGIVFTMNTITSQDQFVGRLATECIQDGILTSKEIKFINSNSKKCIVNHNYQLTLKLVEEIKENKIKLIIVCTNKTRINEICSLVDYINDCSTRKVNEVFLYVDEAHQYVPTHRDKFNIIHSKDIVKRIILYSATPKGISVKNDPIWSRIYIIDTDKEYGQIGDEYFSINDCEKSVYQDTDMKCILDDKIPISILSKIGINDNNTKSLWYKDSFPFSIGNEYRLLNFYKNILPSIGISNTEWSYNFIPGYIRKATHYAIKDMILALFSNATVFIYNGDSKLQVYRNNNFYGYKNVDNEPSEQIEKVIKEKKLEKYPCFITGCNLVGMSVTLVSKNIGNFDRAFFVHNQYDESRSYQFWRCSFNYSFWSQESRYKIKKTIVYTLGEEYIEKCCNAYEHVKYIQEKCGNILSHRELNPNDDSEEKVKVNKFEAIEQYSKLLGTGSKNYTKISVTPEMEVSCWDKIFKLYEEHTDKKIPENAKPKKEDGFYTCSVTGKREVHKYSDMIKKIEKFGKFSAFALHKDQYKYARIFVGYHDLENKEEYNIIIRRLEISKNERTSLFLQTIKK